MFSTPAKITEFAYAVGLVIVLIAGGFAGADLLKVLPFAMVIVVISWIHVWVLPRKERQKAKNNLAVMEAEEAKERAPVKWDGQVERAAAEADGLTAGDLNFMQWPVTNVRIEPSNTRHIAFWYTCDIHPDVPKCNLYREDGSMIPDPKGLCLQSVKFELMDAMMSNRKLDAQVTLPSSSQVRGVPTSQAALWQALTPGTIIHVKLIAWPVFFFLNPDGGMDSKYFRTSDGQAKGARVESEIIRLRMDHNGKITILA